MIGRMYELVIDCPDPKALASFYSQLLGYEELYADEGWVTLGKGDRVRLAFQHAPDHQPPRWPDPDFPQQMHIDVWVDDLDSAQSRVVALGAVPLGGEPENGFRVYADPAGHPFCLCIEDAEAP